MIWLRTCAMSASQLHFMVDRASRLNTGHSKDLSQLHACTSSLWGNFLGQPWKKDSHCWTPASTAGICQAEQVTHLVCQTRTASCQMASVAEQTCIGSRTLQLSHSMRSMTHSNSMIGSRTTVTATAKGKVFSMGMFAGSPLGAILPALGLC